MKTPFPAESDMHQWGNPHGQVLFFLHANSFSSRMYKPFLEPLKDEYSIWSPDLPGHGDSHWNGRIESWVDLADYYISQLEKTPPPAPMIAMGHSIGGIVVMIMATQKPDWFKKVILLDPVLLPKRILTVIRGLRLLSLTHRIPLARAANRRRNSFESQAKALEHYARKRIFSQWEPRFLETYVDTCLRKNDRGEYQLSCSPELESSIYQSIPLNVWSLPKKMSTPCLFIIGERSDTVNQRGVKRLKRSRRNHIVKSVPAGHLFPFEKPEESMIIIKDYLTQ